MLLLAIGICYYNFNGNDDIFSLHKGRSEGIFRYTWVLF